jgi:maleylpyruvate isomerase
MRLALHSFWRSSCSWRVRIGLAWKGLPWEYRAVNLLEGAQFQPEHRARSPLGQVPCLEVEEGGRVLHLVQSMAILEWLEERFPQRPLLPADPWGRARVRALAEHVNAGTQPFQNASTLKWLREERPGLDEEWVRHWLGFALGGLERAVAGEAGRYCHGDEVTLADLFLAPQLYGARRFGVDLAPFPTLTRVESALRKLEAFQQAEPDRQPDAPRA